MFKWKIQKVPFFCKLVLPTWQFSKPIVWKQDILPVSVLVVSNNAIFLFGKWFSLFFTNSSTYKYSSKSLPAVCTKCSTPIAVLLSPSFAPIHFGIYFAIILTMVRTFKMTYGDLGQWLSLFLFWPNFPSSCPSLIHFPYHCNNLHLLLLSFLSAHLIPETKHFLSTYRANSALLNSCSMGVEISWVIMLPDTQVLVKIL